jgi:hypothetical protein
MSKTADEATLKFYDHEAEKYCERTGAVPTPNGLLFASFKAGEREGRDKFGRYYNYLSPIRLRTIFEQAALWASLEIQEAPGMGYDGVSVTWLNCTAIKV